jgi:hypothetical protein
MEQEKNAKKKLSKQKLFRKMKQIEPKLFTKDE